MIHIDPRAGSGPFLPLFQSHRAHPPCTFTPLPAADFSFVISGPSGPTLLGIERKTITDMLSSIRSQRLSGEQLPKLLSHYGPHAYILLEGVYRINPATGYLQHKRRVNGKPEWVDILLGKHPFYAEEMQGALATIQQKTPIKFWRTCSESETVEWVVDMWKWGQKDWDKHHAHLGIHTPEPYVGIEKASTVRRVAYALGGVGWEKSGKAEEAFA